MIFLRMWRWFSKLDQFHHEGACIHWIFIVTVNCILFFIYQRYSVQSKIGVLLHVYCCSGEQCGLRVFLTGCSWFFFSIFWHAYLTSTATTKTSFYYLLLSNFFGISLVSKSQEKNRRGISISIINFKSLLYIYVHTSRRTFKEKTLEEIMDIVALSPLIMISRCFALWCWVVVVVYLSANIHANKVVCKTFFIYSKIWKEKSSEGCCNGRCRSKDGVFWGKYNEHIKYDCIFNRILKDSVALKCKHDTKRCGYNKETQSVFDRWLLGFFELCLRLYVFRHTCFSETRFRMEGNRYNI